MISRGPAIRIEKKTKKQRRNTCRGGEIFFFFGKKLYLKSAHDNFIIIINIIVGTISADRTKRSTDGRNS